MRRDKIAISITIFLISIMLVSSMIIQFRTVEKTKGIESMNENELEQRIATLKEECNKIYEEIKSGDSEVDEMIKSNNKKIEEYTSTIQDNQKASELLDSELKEYNMLVGKTDVVGEGVILKLEDTDEMSFSASNLIYLVNELKRAGAEAISINNQRIINSTDIVSINGNQYILVNGEKVGSPFEVKAIGNKEKLNVVLNSDDEAYVQEYKRKGYTLDISFESNIKILAYDKEMTLKYIKEEE